MKNMMKEYLKNDYSDNHLRNFCLYWTKAAGGSGDEWRRGNDLDCLYFGGDLRADTLMSAWTPIKWVADLINKDRGVRFCKRRKDSDDPCRDLRILAEEGEKYLPHDNRLVKLLDTFLELAEQRCNFILLTDRRMNRARYKSYINGKKVWLCDEVPVTLSHVFDKNSLGRYFTTDAGEVDKSLVTSWIKREHLEMGFTDNRIAPENVRPLIEGLDPYKAKWLKDADEIEEALGYMIDFLEKRMDALQQQSRKCNAANASSKMQ